MEKTNSVLLSGISSQMQGVGRLPDGRAVFVPGAIPGEEALVEIQKDAGRFANARLLRVVSASPDRREPFCPRYGVCGGCACQHMDYSATLRFKRQVVADALSRIGGQKDNEVSETLGMHNPFGYRNKVEFALSRDGYLGFARSGSHEIVPCLDCPLLAPALSKTALCAQTWLRGPGRGTRIAYVVARANGVGEVCLTLSLMGGDPQGLDALRSALPDECVSVYLCRLRQRPAHALDGNCKLLWGAPTLMEEVNGLRFSLNPQSFFQVNREQCAKLMALVASAAAPIRASSPIAPASSAVADVYCGVGSLSLAVAAREGVKSVTGFEIVPQAIENANANAAYNRLSDRTRFFSGDAALTLPREIDRGSRFDTIVVDPPRKGVDPQALCAILRAAPKNIVYVSCNPATLARDVKELSARYALRFAQPVDMFPWTEHVETVVLMSRVKE